MDLWNINFEWVVLVLKREIKLYIEIYGERKQNKKIYEKKKKKRKSKWIWNNRYNIIKIKKVKRSKKTKQSKAYVLRLEIHNIEHITFDFIKILYKNKKKKKPNKAKKKHKGTMKNREKRNTQAKAKQFFYKRKKIKNKICMYVDI